LLLKPELHHWFCDVLVTIGYLVYQNSLLAKTIEAADEMFVAQENFQQATNGVASDSLYKLSLNGSEGKFDLLKLRMSILVLMET
jgi:hypothetical protein